MKQTLQIKTNLFATLSKLLVLVIMVGMSKVGMAQIQWSNTGALTAWYTNTNWTPNTASNAWTTSSYAQFNNTGTATTAGINMGTSSLSLGAIEVTSSRTRALTIGNSSGTTGTLTLNGITVNSIGNTILRNASNSLFTLQDNETGTGKTMNIALANSTDNIIAIDGTGGITISSVISGASRNLRKTGSGSGVLTLSGTNTYTGITTISSGILSVATIGNGGVAGNLGQASNAAANIVLGDGTLQYTGATASTNRAFTISTNASATIDVTTNTLTITGAAASTNGGLEKAGNGTLVFSGANAYTGGTIITGGTLTLGAAGVLADAGFLMLNGGTFRTGNTTGFSETIETLDLNASSTLTLGTGTHTLTIAASNGVSWNGASTLTITGWTGGYDGTASATAGRIFIGTNASGLTAAQLAQIQFTEPGSGVNVGAKLLSTGELVPAGRAFYARANTAWNVNSTWSYTSGGAAATSFPTDGDIVFIGETSTNRTPSIPATYTASCASLTLGSNANSSNSLTFSAATSMLNVSGNVTINASGFNSTTNDFILNAGTLNIDGSLIFGDNGGNNTRIGRMTITTGTVNTLGDLIYNISGQAAHGQIVFSGAGTFNLTGAFTINTLATLTPGTTSTFNFNGTSAQTIPIGVSSVTYANLSVNNTSVSGATISAAISATNVTGNITVGDINTGSLLNTNNLAVARAASDVITVAAGSTLNAGTSVISWGGASGSMVINGTFKTANTNGFTGSTTTAINTTTNSPSVTLGANSLIEYNAAGTQTVTQRTDYANVTLTGASKTIAAGAVTLSKTLTINSGATYNGGTNNPTLTIGGDFLNSSTFTQGTNVTTFNGSSAQVIGGTSSTTFTQLTINTSTSAITVTNTSKAFSVTGNLSVTRGNLTLSATDANYSVTGNLLVSSNGTLTHNVDWDSQGKQLTVGGNITIDGAYSKGAASRAHVQMTGTGKTISTGTSSLNILTLAHTGTITANGTVTVNDNFWAPFGTAGVFTTSTFSVTANAGMFVSGGTVNMNGGVVNIIGGLYIGQASSTGTVALSGGSLTTDGITIGNAAGTLAATLTQSGGSLTVNGAVTIHQPAANSITNSWNINNQTATVSGLITFAGSNTTTSRIGQIVLTTGTLNANGGITFTGSAAATKVIDMSGGASNLNIKGNLTAPAASSTLVPGTSSTISFTDASAQTVDKFTTGNMYNVVMSGAGLKTLTSATTITNSLTIASGSSINLGTGLTHAANTLSIGGNGAVNGSWGSTASSATNKNDTYFDVAANGIINVTTSGCTVPQGSLTANGPFCYTGAGQLTFTASAGISPFTVVYYDGTANRTATNVTSGVAFNTFTTPVTSTTTYTLVSVTSVTGCLRTTGFTAASATITVNTVSPVISGTNTICAGQSSTFTASGGDTYLWSNTATTSTISVSSAGVYTATVTVTATGCSAVATRTLTVNALPTPSISGTNTICAGQTSTFTASGGTSYLWSTTATTNTISVSSAGVFTATVTNAAGCSDVASRTLTVNALPTVTASSATVCAGSSATINAGGASTYVWSTSETTSSIVVSSAGTYTVSGTNANGCVNTATGTLTVNAIPTIGATSFPSSTVCSGTSVTLQGTGGASYAWTGGVVNAVAFTATTSASYTVTGTSPFGCQNTASIAISVSNPPTTAVAGSSQSICNNGAVTLAANSPSIGVGSWIVASGPSTNSSQFSDANSPTSSFTPDGGVGNYTLNWRISNAPCPVSTSTLVVTTIGDGIWRGLSSNDWFTSNNWCGGVPSSTSNISISSGTPFQPSINNYGAEANNITINSGATLSMTSDGQLSVIGNWSNAGTFTAGGGEVDFAGTSPQTISGANNFGGLVINNTTGVSVNANQTIATYLVLDNGELTMNGNTITIENGASAGATAGYVNGTIVHYAAAGTGVYLSLPVGSNGNYAGVDVSIDEVTSAGYLSLSTQSGDYTAQIGSSGFDANLTVNRNWNLQNISASTSGNVGVGINYSSIEMDPGVISDFLSLKTYDAGNWNEVVAYNNFSNYFYTTNIPSYGVLQLGQVNPTPQLFALSPATGNQGQTMNISLTGGGFIAGITHLNSIAGITVASSTVVSTSEMIATIDISPSAALGSRQISVSNGTPGGGSSNELVFNVASGTLIANFVATPSTTIVCNVDGVVQFNNYSVAATSYVWNFGAGATPATYTTSSAAPISVTYATVGTKTVSLTAINASGSVTNTKNNYITVTANAPAIPSAISGPVDLCPYGTNPVSYQVSYVNGASSYTWSVPSGATIVSGQGTLQVFVTYTTSFTSGTITVKSNNACASSALRSLTVSRSLPATPGAISGIAAACGLSTTTYSVAAVARATSYTWTVPSGMSIVSGNNTNIIGVSFSGNYSGNLSVKANNGCGSSVGSSNLFINRLLPGTIVTLSGPGVAICAADTLNFSCSIASDANYYYWSLPAGLQVRRGQGTRNITAERTVLLTVPISGTVSVTPQNTCGDGPVKAITINSSLGTLGNISGPTNICSLIGQVVTYSVAPVVGAITYNWSYPGAGVQYYNGQTTNVLQVKFTSAYPNSGTFSVTATNGCVSTAPKTLAVGKTAVGAISSITGPTAICNLDNITYTCSAASNATTYTWTLPAGLTVSSGQGTRTIVATRSVSLSTVITGSITVTASSICSSSTKSLVVGSLPAALGALAGPTNVCPFIGSSASYSVAAVASISTYTWALPTGASVSSGQGSNSVEVAFTNSFPASGTFSITPSNACASGTTKTLTVTKPVAGAIATLSGPTSICGLDNITYTCSASTNANSYNWNLPTGLVIGSGVGTRTITAVRDIGITIDTPISGTVSVSATNVCSSSAVKNLAVNSNPAALGAIVGAGTICSGITSGSYSVAPLAGAGNTYTWSMTSTTATIGSNGTNNTTVNFAPNYLSGATLSVRGTNSCGVNTATKTLRIYKINCGMASSQLNNDLEDASSNNVLSVTVYPNPVSSEVNIELSTADDKVIIIEMYDVLGNKVMEIKQAITIGSTVLQSSLDEFDKGVYFIRVLDAKGTNLYKTSIIKQ